MARWPIPIVALVWGLDTGLAVTTFRVVTATWAVFVLLFLGLGANWTGLAYGLGFAVPCVAMICNKSLTARIDKDPNTLLRVVGDRKRLFQLSSSLANFVLAFLVTASQ